MKLFAWRKAQGKTQMEVATFLGVNQSHIARFEAGILIPNKVTMEDIFQMTGGHVTANDFHDFRVRPVVESPREDGPQCRST